MNIFFLDTTPRECAQMHNDKHVVKMILEYAQLLSTAHRVLDGVETIESRVVPESSPLRYRKYKVWKLLGYRDTLLYKTTHSNHPSALWCRQSRLNYEWLWMLLKETCIEYTNRYKKVHSVESSGLLDELAFKPTNMPFNTMFSEATPAMPEQYKVLADSVTSYRNYYLGEKVRISRWTNREMPIWFAEGINTLYGDTGLTFKDVKKDRIISMPRRMIQQI